MKNKSRSNTKSKSQVLKISGMIALAFLAIIIGGVIMFNKAQSEISQLNSEKTVLQDNLFERDSLVNELVSSFDTIEQNLTFINERRSQLVLENMETANPSKKESIIKDIQLMNTMLEESSKEIEELEKKLKSSGIQLRSFKNKIASLNKSIKQQNNQIVDLKMQIEDQNTRLVMVNLQKDSLQNKVIFFRDSLNQKEEILVQKEELIIQQVNEINKGFFASGTYNELFENGVIYKEGGFLGIGRNKTIQNDFNEEYFTKVDISESRTIPLNAKKVNLISEHPSGSYKLIEENGLITKLEIETPKDFWKISQYAVIEVKL